MNILLRGDAKRARDDLLDIALSLPFQTDVNTGFGILAKVYLDALTHINNRQRVRDPNAEGVKEAKQLALDICEETFPGIKNPKAEVERGFRFWDCVSTISLSPIQSPSPQVFLSLFSQNGLSEYVTDEPSSLCLYFPSFSLRFAAYAMGYSGNRLGFFLICRRRVLCGMHSNGRRIRHLDGNTTGYMICWYWNLALGRTRTLVWERIAIGGSLGLSFAPVLGVGNGGERMQALTAMRQMHSEKAVLPELTEQFEAAEVWLRPMRP